MKKVIAFTLMSVLLLCGCGNMQAAGDVSANDVSDNAVSENVSEENTLSEDAAVADDEAKEETEKKPALIVSVSENEAEMTKTFTFSRLPDSVEDLEKISVREYNDPYYVAALAIASVCQYKNSPEECVAMLTYLNGTEGLTEYEIELINNGLKDKEYKGYSYLEGATWENDYEPSIPYSVKIYGDKFTFVLEGRVKVFVYSAGCDSQRAINVRYDDEVKRWCVYEHGLLGDIKKPGPEEIIEEEEEEEIIDEASDIITDQTVNDQTATDQTVTEQSTADTQPVNAQAEETVADTVEAE